MLGKVGSRREVKFVLVYDKLRYLGKDLVQGVAGLNGGIWWSG